MGIVNTNTDGFPSSYPATLKSFLGLTVVIIMFISNRSHKSTSSKAPEPFSIVNTFHIVQPYVILVGSTYFQATGVLSAIRSSFFKFPSEMQTFLIWYIIFHQVCRHYRSSSSTKQSSGISYTKPRDTNVNLTSSVAIKQIKNNGSIFANLFWTKSSSEDQAAIATIGSDSAELELKDKKIYLIPSVTINDDRAQALRIIVPSIINDGPFSQDKLIFALSIAITDASDRQIVKSLATIPLSNIHEFKKAFLSLKIKEGKIEDHKLEAIRGFNNFPLVTNQSDFRSFLIHLASNYYLIFYETQYLVNNLITSGALSRWQNKDSLLNYLNTSKSLDINELATSLLQEKPTFFSGFFHESDKKRANEAATNGNQPSRSSSPLAKQDLNSTSSELTEDYSSDTQKDSKSSKYKFCHKKKYISKPLRIDSPANKTKDPSSETEAQAKPYRKLCPGPSELAKPRNFEERPNLSPPNKQKQNSERKHKNKEINFELVLKMSSAETDIPGILATLRQESDPQLATFYYTFEDLYQRKLYHQLTLSLIEFYKSPLSDPIKLRIYNNFISHFKYKLNLLKLVEFLIASLINSSDFNESLTYLNELKTDLTNQEHLDKEQALILIDIEIAKYELKTGEISRAREILDSIDNILKNLDSIDLKLKQSFFQTNSEYYKFKSDYNNFYYQSLLYLSTLSNIDELSNLNQQKLAYELSISALLGDKIYNFGELLTHPILKTLDNGEYSWLIEILHSLNSGDLAKFSKNLEHLSKIPILKNSESFLRQKICLMTLVELVFSQTIRIISFEDVSKATLLNLDEVEHLVMRALSLGLLKGSIDQINQLITINWVQPRIVNNDQIDAMKKKLIDWDSNVSKLGRFMEENGKEIWIQ